METEKQYSSQVTVPHPVTYILLSAILFIILGIVYIFLALYVYAVSQSPLQSVYPTLLILGARPYENGKPNLCLVSRVDTAVGLYKKNPQTTIVVSGRDNVVDQNNEAFVMRQWLLDRGVRKEKIVTELKAQNTYENILYASKLSNIDITKGMTIVTESFHAPRAYLIAKSLQLPASIVSATSSPCINQGFLSTYFLREPIAILIYILTGRIHVEELITN